LPFFSVVNEEFIDVTIKKITNVVDQIGESDEETQG